MDYGVDGVSRPLAIDLFCGSFGWSAGWLELGGRVVGVDIDHQPHHGPVPPGADLVLQDVRTIDGARFKDASLILASPPCTEFSYMAMPWARAKQIAAWLKGEGDFPAGYAGSRTVAELTELFDACFRIQREAIAAAGRYIPLVIENVRGAQPWVGRSRWHHGSFHLWGDVPALMPITTRVAKVRGFGGLDAGVGFNVAAVRQMKADARFVADDLTIPRAVKEGRLTPEQGETAKSILFPSDDSVKIGGARGDDWFTHHNRDEFVERATKNSGGSSFAVAHNTTSGKGQNPDGRLDGVKQGGTWFHDSNGTLRAHSSKSNARKAASAHIARIPLALARHIARAYWPHPTPCNPPPPTLHSAP